MFNTISVQSSLPYVRDPPAGLHLRRGGGAENFGLPLPSTAYCFFAISCLGSIWFLPKSFNKLILYAIFGIFIFSFLSPQ